jgi:hypothetical protein
MTKPSDIQKPQPVVEKSKEANTNTLKQTAEVNKDVATQQSSAATKATTEEIKDEQNIGNKYISHQVLAEPIRVVSPESIINAAIAAVNVLGQAIINPIKEKLEVIQDLSQNPSAINSNQIKDCIDKTNKKCTTIAQTHAKTLELANGHIINGAFNALINSGNSVHIVSDTATVNRSPFFSLSAQDTSIQSNNSFNVITDFNFNQFKQDVKFVEGTKISQSQTSLNVATATNDSIAKVNRTVGVEENSSLGKVNKVIADNTLLAVSGDTAQIASYGDMGMQSNGNIAILSTKPNTLSDIAASGEEVVENIPTPTTISIINSSNDYSDMLVMSNQGILSSTTGNQFSLSADLNLTVGDKGAVMTSEKFTYFGNPNGGTYTIGGRSFLGKLSFPIIDLDQAEIVDIPSLPVLPSLPQQQLENCLPSGVKNKNTFEDYNPDQETVLTGGTTENPVFNPDTFNNSQSFKSKQAEVKPPSVPSANNKVELPRESSTFPNYDPNSESMFSGKLPPPSVSSDINSSSALFIPWQTAAGVLPTKYTPESKTNIVNLSTDETFYTFNSFINFLQEDDLLQELAASLRSPEELVTSKVITNYVENIVPSSVIDTLKYAQFYIDLFKVSIEKLENFAITIEDFISADKNIVQQILTLIQEYPALKEQIVKLVKDLTVLPAIGFLGAIGSISGFISNGISSFNNITNVINVVQGGNLGEIFNLAKPFLGSSLQGTSFGQLLNNPDLLNIGQSLLSGDLSGVGDLLLKKVEGVLTDKLSTVLDNCCSLSPALLDIFNKVKLGQPINPTDYINDIASVLGGNEFISQATSIYRGIEGLLQDISNGDILSVITGSNLNGLLNQVLGAETAGTISKVFNLVKDGIGLVESVKLLPDLLNLMNDYNVPAIDQVSIALNCLDLFNKTKGLLDSVNGLSNGKNTAAFLENAGRLTELKNTLDSLDDTTLEEISDQLNQELDEEIDLIEYKRILSSNLVLDNCFKLPKLNLFQSEIEVLEVRPQSIIFKLTNFDILKSDVYLLPKRNDLVQLRVAGFYSLSSREYLVPYQTDFQYTPSIYTFVISQYNAVSNIGIAFYDKSYSSIVLENEDGLLYKFNTEAIGNSLNLDIVDSYLLA